MVCVMCLKSGLRLSSSTGLNFAEAYVRVMDALLGATIQEEPLEAHLGRRLSPRQQKVTVVKGVGFEPTYLPPVDGCSPMSYPLFDARYLTGTVLAAPPKQDNKCHCRADRIRTCYHQGKGLAALPLSLQPVVGDGAPWCTHPLSYLPLEGSSG